MFRCQFKDFSGLSSDPGASSSLNSCPRQLTRIVSLFGQVSVDLAEDGEVAWQRVQERSYHCIILDLKMPGMSGQQLYRAIDALDREQARKVIFLTGDMVNPDTFDFVTGSGNPAFSKPVNLDELHRQVRITLELTREPIEEPTGSSVYPPSSFTGPDRRSHEGDGVEDAIF